jgi:hypothetical protein
MNEIWINQNWWWVLIIFVWSFAWKAFALWRSARNNDKVWFIVLAIVNTAGILEIFYLFYFSKKETEHKKHITQ